MPSASAKIEKIASPEAADPVKQIVNLIEKRIRNLEKRKIKLDNYKLDVKNGKELNEDQKIAVSKFDQVESLLDFTRELSKASNSIVLETGRQQKKLAKKEQLERQQHEIQRLQEAFFYCHILSCFQNEDVRSDFLNGENGAVQLASEQLSQLDQLYKLIGPGLPSEQADITNHFHALAENHIFLVEGRNKEIVGTTYKVLKDLLQSIKECGYFSRPSGAPIEEDISSSEGIPEFEAVAVKEELNDEEVNDVTIEDEQLPSTENYDDEEEEEEETVIVSSPAEEVTSAEVAPMQNGPLQEVLSSQGAFNFLQESQIDLDAPHMDPAVVAVHQMAPPPAVNYDGNTYPASPLLEEKPLTNGPETCAVSPNSISHVPGIPAGIPCTVTPVLPTVPLNSQQDFDPSHPIPTQTFTNQSFAVMQNMIMPQAYVPVTMHHGPMPPHIAPIAVVPGLSSTVTPGASVVPLHAPVGPVSVPPVINSPPVETESKSKEINGAQISDDLETDPGSSNGTHEKIGENGYGPHYRGGYNRRGRGRSNNGYYRGRQNYNGRGGYQNHYYQDRNGYNGNYRRGNNRGGPRGNGNIRGRGNYNKPQQQQGSPAQQQPPPPQQQQTQQQ